MKSVTPSEREEENEENILTEDKTAQRDRGRPTLGKRECPGQKEKEKEKEEEEEEEVMSSVTPDRPGRPSVPTPGKYGTRYGGAPSPGPQPSLAFRPPGFVPPTPPTSISTSTSRKVLRLSQTRLLSSISEESARQNTKKTKLSD